MRADEVVVAKETADLLRLDVGDRAGFTAYRSGEYGGVPTGPTGRLTVVGIVRTPRDLVAGLDAGASVVSKASPYAGPGFWKRYGNDPETWGTSVLVRAADDNVKKFDALLHAEFPGRYYSIGGPVDGARDVAKEKNARDAIGYETAALLVAALVGAAAWLVFVGQALVRQSVHEHGDSRTLVALGMTRSQLRRRGRTESSSRCRRGRG